jgi:hypothetical protein
VELASRYRDFSFRCSSYPDAEQSERAEVAAKVRELIAASGRTQARFAADLGTSASRLSTYASGSVVPSATLLVRMRRVAETARDGERVNTR